MTGTEAVERGGVFLSLKCFRYVISTRAVTGYYIQHITYI